MNSDDVEVSLDIFVDARVELSYFNARQYVSADWVALPWWLLSTGQGRGCVPWKYLECHEAYEDSYHARRHHLREHDAEVRPCGVGKVGML